MIEFLCFIESKRDVLVLWAEHRCFLMLIELIVFVWGPRDHKLKVGIISLWIFFLFLERTFQSLDEKKLFKIIFLSSSHEHMRLIDALVSKH